MQVKTDVISSLVIVKLVLVGVGQVQACKIKVIVMRIIMRMRIKGCRLLCRGWLSPRVALQAGKLEMKLRCGPGVLSCGMLACFLLCAAAALVASSTLTVAELAARRKQAGHAAARQVGPL